MIRQPAPMCEKSLADMEDSLFALSCELLDQFAGIGSWVDEVPQADMPLSTAAVSGVLPSDMMALVQG